MPDARPPDTAAPLKSKKEEKEKEKQKVVKMDEDEDEEEEESSDDDNMSDDENSDEEDPPEDIDLPEIEWPCTITIIAKKFSGKTNMLYNLVKPSEWDNVFCVTRTKRTGNMDRLVHDKRCVLTEMSDRFLEEVIRHNEGFEHGKEPRTLIIFDDFAGTKWRATSSLAMQQLASSGRNAGISMIFSAQDPKFVPTEVRRNTEYMVLGNNAASIIDKLSKDNATANLPKEQLWGQLTDIARKRDYRFVWMDDRNASWRQWLPAKLKD